jgi:hypothetical protein
MALKSAGAGLTVVRGCSQRASTGKIWSRWIRPPKIDDYDVVLTFDDIAVSSSDRMHGTTPKFSFCPETKI